MLVVEKERNEKRDGALAADRFLPIVTAVKISTMNKKREGGVGEGGVTRFFGR